MISEKNEFGGAVRVSSSGTRRMSFPEARVYTVDASGVTLKLPRTDQLTASDGGRHFLVWADGVSVDVEDSSGNVVTVGSNEHAFIYYMGPGDDWVATNSASAQVSDFTHEDIAFELPPAPPQDDNDLGVCYIYRFNYCGDPDENPPSSILWTHKNMPNTGDPGDCFPNPGLVSVDFGSPDGVFGPYQIRREAYVGQSRPFVEVDFSCTSNPCDCPDTTTGPGICNNSCGSCKPRTCCGELYSPTAIGTIVCTLPALINNEPVDDPCGEGIDECSCFVEYRTGSDGPDCTTCETRDVWCCDCDCDAADPICFVNADWIEGGGCVDFDQIRCGRPECSCIA